MKPFRRLASLVLLLCAGAAPALAAPRWTPLGPFGGSVLSVTVDPTDARVVYAVTNFNGAFKSVDGGLHWLPLRRGFLTGGLAVDPARPRNLYLTTSQPDLVVRSTDGGATWAPSRRGLPQAGLRTEVVAVDPALPSRVYLGVSVEGVWRSLDRGATWRPARRPLPRGASSILRAIVPLPRPAGTVFAATVDGLFVSTDGGDSWRRVDGRGGLPQDEFLALAAAPSDPRTLWAVLRNHGTYLSRDGGASWAATPSQPDDGDLKHSLAVSPASPLTAWVGTLSHGSFATTDGGVSWKPVGPRDDVDVHFLTASPTALYADAGEGIAASTDGGATWQARNQGLANVAVVDLAVDPRTPRLLWAAAGFQGLFRSADRGRSWARLVLPFAGPFAPSVVSTAVSADGGTAYAADGLHLLASDDGGASWRTAEGTPGAVTRVRADPDDPAKVYAGGNRGLAVSRDAGATWQATGLPALCSLDDLAIAPSSPATLYAAGSTNASVPFCKFNLGPALLRSRDGGATWTDVSAGLAGGAGQAVAVDVADPQTVYASANGLWKSRDGGDTWRRLGGPWATRAPGALAVGSDGTVWGAAAFSGEVFASRDGGATWTAEGTPQALAISRLVPDPAGPRRVYAATSGSVWLLEDRP